MTSGQSSVNLLVRINQKPIADPFYSVITECITKELQTSDIGVRYYVMHENTMNSETFSDVFQNAAVLGNILVGADFDLDLLASIQGMQIPTVLVDGTYPKFSCVNTDNQKGAMDAVTYLAQQEHKEIMFLSGPMEHNSIAQRFQGYKAAMEAMNGGVPRHMVCDGVSIDDGYQRVMEVDTFDFTALFAATDKLAIGAMRALAARGKKVPEDISVIGFDDIEWGLYSEPPLSTMHVAKSQLGRQAAHLLLNILQDEEMASVDINVSTKLIVRQSVSPPKR